MNIFSDTYLIQGGILTILLQLSFFFIAYSLQIDLVTDFGGASNFMLLAILSYSDNQNACLRSKVITICVVIWSIRLALFLFYRILKTGKDNRFDAIRHNFNRFLIFWICQMVWVYVVSLPSTITNSKVYNDQSEFGNVLDKLGLFLFAFGLVIEVIADYQRFHFLFTRSSKLDVIHHGLWYYSRHPNYFGEISLWWGIYIISLSSNNLFYITILSPILTMLLLLKVSGIPKSEPIKHQNILKNGTKQQIEDYNLFIQSTSPIIPMPPVIYKNIPLKFKQIFLFEFPSYQYNAVNRPLLNNDE